MTVRALWKPRWVVGASWLVMVGVTVCAGSAEGADWPHFRGPTYDGISTETGWKTTWPADGPKILWRAQVGTGFSSFAVSKGRVYTMGNSGNKDTVFCWEADTGKEIWKFSYSCPLKAKYYEGGTHSTPTVDGDRVYTVSKVAQVYCLDAATGKEKWSKTFRDPAPEWGFAGSARVIDKMIIVNIGSGGVAMDKMTGRIIWRSEQGVSGYSTAVPFKQGAQQCVALAGTESYYAVMAANGTKLWEHPWKTKYFVNAPDPIFVKGNKMFISTGYNRGCALLLVGMGAPKVIWENRRMSNKFNSCVLWKGYLYGYDEKDFKCLELASGREKWCVKRLGIGGQMLADGKLIVMSEQGKLIVAEASEKEFKPLASAQVLGGKKRCWSTPTLSNGRIYVRDAGGNVACVDVKGE